MHRPALLFFALFSLACGLRSKPDMNALTKEFVESSLALSPSMATSAGLHSFANKKLDGELDDVSAAGIEKQRAHWQGWSKKLEDLKPEELDAESRADLELMRAQVKLALYDLDTLQQYKNNPTIYVELMGNALFAPWTLEYAPKPERVKDIISRLRELPRFVEQAKGQLKSAPGVWKTVAVQENDGNIELVEKTFAAGVPDELKVEYAAAAGPAAAALKDFNHFIAALPDEGADAWRLGKQKYEGRFALIFGKKVTPDQLYADAEEAMRETRRKMFMLSLPIHHKMYPTHKDRVDVNLIVGEVLTKLAQDHVPAKDYFAEAKVTLQEAKDFVGSHGSQVVPLLGSENLQLIETPEFMRGIYSVGGFNPAPPLEPKLGAFYWLTPVPPEWPAARQESKLREYNRYGLRLLTLHEAIPGHYLQAEYAAQVQPAGRRALRAIYGSGSYVEGWAVYSSEVALNAGYLDNSPELQLTFYKQLLRAIANTMIDIGFQSRGMTREQALELMESKTFQEKEEAEAKVIRAQLAACQLPTYYAGYRQWWDLRKAAEQRDGDKFDAGQFHQKALLAGALRMETLRALLGLSGAKPPAPQ